ncbi:MULTISPECIES: ABC transporter permease [unclassified Arthrobacter]|uniref:ABC transporter permease n=1 Tax=unclassified Arthrobacter TaxID=235627 RepID=UPI00159EB31F|nr:MULTISPECIES: ABC transporter permease [unclassified Arthrobacter]MCQ9165863.1 ABC transporter permease [Arthrobacter sp. STN4]NVM99885.1 ABC transporter permease [Arthrobacter sp. SDTb3-6]
MTVIARKPAGPGAGITVKAPRKKGLLRRALRSKRTIVGLVLSLLIFAIAFLGPYIAPHSPTEFVGAPFSPAGVGGAFGTDNLGRDVLSRFLAGGQTLMILSVLATGIGVGLGALVGVFAAYSRGWVDEALMRTGDVALAFPQIVLALLFLSIIGPKLWLLVLMVALGHLPRVARVVRGAAMSVVERDFVKAAESVGIPRWKIMVGEIVPNLSSTLAVEFGLRLTYSIGLVAGLSFLGLGMQPPSPDWGLMINENRVALTVSPWSVVLPVAAIALLTVGTNLVTDGLSKAAIGSNEGVEA